MKRSSLEDLPVELLQTAERLREERPTASPLELDRMKQQVRSRAARTPAIRPLTKGSLLKSRLAITSMLVLGLLMSSTGAALSLSGSSESGSSEQSQYPPTPPGDKVKGVQEGPTLAGDQVAGKQESTGGPSVSPAQQTRQVAANSGNDRLPFTGLAAIPILLAGLLLMLTGLALRRGVRGNEG